MTAEPEPVQAGERIFCRGVETVAVRRADGTGQCQGCGRTVLLVDTGTAVRRASATRLLNE